MYIFVHLRAFARDQDTSRAQQRLKAFALEHKHRVEGWYVENASGASLQRPELMRLLNDAKKGALVLIAQVDRLSRLDDEGCQQLKRMMQEKNLAIINLYLPTIYAALRVLRFSCESGFR